MKVNNIFSVIVTSLTVVLNMVGLKLLHNIRNIKETQKVLLSHLSISDALNAITALAGILVIRQVYGSNGAYGYGALAAHCILVSCEALIIITIDRVIATAMPFRYSTIVTKRRLLIFIITAWIVTLTFITVLVTTKEVSRIHSYTFYVTSSTEVIIFVSYLYIALKIRKSRKKSTADNSTSVSMNRQSKKMILVSSCIVLSFAIFVAVPDIVLYFSDVQQEGLICMIQLYYLCNPVIYIYCYPSMRIQILAKLREVRQVFINNHRVRNSTKMENSHRNPEDKVCTSAMA